MSSHVDKTVSVTERLLAVRKSSFLLFHEDNAFPSTLPGAFIDLTTIRTALQFFGTTMLLIEDQNRAAGSQEADTEAGKSCKLSPATMLSLEIKCYEHWERFEEELRGSEIPGLSLEQTKGVLDVVQPQGSNTKVVVIKFFRQFLKSLGHQCLFDLKALWLRIDPAAAGGIPILRDAKLEGDGIASPRLVVPSRLLEVPSPATSSPVLPSGTVYSTGRPAAASSSPSAALRALTRSAESPIDLQNTEYGRQVLGSVSPYFGSEIISRESSRHGDDRSIAEHDTLNSSTTALSGPSLSSKIRGINIGRAWSKSPSSSTKPPKSRDASVSGSEPARVGRPLPPLRPIIVGSTSNMILSNDQKGFYSKDGMGERDTSEPLIGILGGLDTVTRKRLLSSGYLLNLCTHAGKCQLRFHEDPKAIMSQRIGNTSQQIPAHQSRQLDFGFQRTGGASGFFVFNLICCKEEHSTASLECTKVPFVYRHPVDLGATLESLEDHSVNRAIATLRDLARQLLVATEAAAAERALNADSVPNEV